jgi:hypothetical protein
MWQTGTGIALRGIYNQRPWYVESAIVVKDTPQEVALLVAPGAECAAPSEYIHGKHGKSQQWDRWELMLGNSWQLERYNWHTNRFLILLEPGKFYSVNYVWNHASDAFLCYYVNFQLPFERSQYGFDTFDLELDLVIEPDLSWKWKDVEEYQRGIQNGILRPEWVRGIERAKTEVFARLEGRLYPFDGSWLQWRPDSAWAASRLPAGWEHA